nr:hypothetical protein BaRGS_032199 [Batillaria attramentaria]
MSQAALYEVRVIVTRDGSESARQVKIVRGKDSDKNTPPNGTREAVVYVTQEEKAALDARANGEKPSLEEDERAEDETDEGENRAEGNVRCYSGQEDYVSKEQNMTLETSAFTSIMHGGDNEKIIHSTPRDDGEQGGQAGGSEQQPGDQASSGDQTDQQENNGDNTPTQQGDGDQGQAGGEDEADGNGAADNNDNGGGDGGEEGDRGGQAESSLNTEQGEEEAATPQQPQEEGNKAEGEEVKERVSSAGRNRANELEGLDIERGEDELPDPETDRGKLPEEFRIVAKPERGDEGIVKKIPPPPCREPSATSRGGGKYRAYNDDDRGLEKEFFLGDPTIKEEYHTSDNPTDDTVSEIESRPSTRPFSACSQSSKATARSEKTAASDKTGVSEKTGASEETGASEKEKKKKKKKSQRHVPEIHTSQQAFLKGEPGLRDQA